MMKNFDEVISKYPQFGEEIAKAFQIVLGDTERDLGCELNALGVTIEDEDISKLEMDIVQIVFGGVQ